VIAEVRILWQSFRNFIARLCNGKNVNEQIISQEPLHGICWIRARIGAIKSVFVDVRCSKYITIISNLTISQEPLHVYLPHPMYRKTPLMAPIWALTQHIPCSGSWDMFCSFTFFPLPNLAIQFPNDCHNILTSAIAAWSKDSNLEAL